MTEVIREVDGETEDIWYLVNGRAHRDASEGPAHIRRDTRTGLVYEEGYYWNNVRHRTDGPARITRDAPGLIAIEQWYRHGQLHRDPIDGPASIEWTYSGDVPAETEYLYRGEPCRHPDDGPVFIARDTSTGKFRDRQYMDVEELKKLRHLPPCYRHLRARAPAPK
jgi:hypothetical protein